MKKMILISLCTLAAQSFASAAEPPKMDEQSLDAVDFASYHAGPAPMDSAPKEITLVKGRAAVEAGPVTLRLDGEWQMAENGVETDRLTQPWADAIPAPVPGRVHSALQASGKIPDPKFGRNDTLARAKSFQTWWFKHTFTRPAGITGGRLVFDGVAIHSSIWLNGTKLGEHEGMFGGPIYDVAALLRDDNVLIVKLDPAPTGPIVNGLNKGWKTTVVFNNVWGWHYSYIPALGIWRSVWLEGAPTVKMAAPFIATHEAQAGVMDLAVSLLGPATGWKGEISGTIEPENFQGQPFQFKQAVESSTTSAVLRLRFAIPDAQLWWPNGLGAQNLYRLSLSLKAGGGGVGDSKVSTFGIRTIKMAPQPGGPNPEKYNWTFVVNGRPTFIKGSGWCTMDSSMDFSRAKYDRFLSLAKQQHVQLLRAWGCGMPETDDFYDLCDRYGILVMQEWPTASDSHDEQPYDALEETVRLNTLRLRNHPSLAMWGGGNETKKPFGKAIDMMGRLANELDGTRPFHRGEPWGGSMHSYDSWWGDQPLYSSYKATALFFGEFGTASMPVMESVLRYLPEDEKNQWPAPKDGSFAYHTPKFNTKGDIPKLQRLAGYFTAGNTLGEFIRGTQLAQAVGNRVILERARTRWPECTGALYYKINDNYPAASWSTVDWYGAPKIGHYLIKDSFAPLVAVAIFDKSTSYGEPLSVPIFLLDDADALKDSPWEVCVRAYGSNLKLIKEAKYAGSGSVAKVKPLGAFKLEAAQTMTTPLLMVMDVRKAGKLVQRNYNFTNFEPVKDCLFTLPKSTVTMKVANGTAELKNTGSLPALGVSIGRPGHLDTFTAEENYFWLDAGEAKTVKVSDVEGLAVGGWNVDTTEK